MRELNICNIPLSESEEYDIWWIRSMYSLLRVSLYMYISNILHAPTVQKRVYFQCSSPTVQERVCFQCTSRTYRTRTCILPIYFTYGTRKKIMVQKLYETNQHYSAGLVCTILALLVYPVCGWPDMCNLWPQTHL